MRTTNVLLTLREGNLDRSNKYFYAEYVTDFALNKLCYWISSKEIKYLNIFYTLP